MSAAGADAAAVDFEREIVMGEYSANVSRGGFVFLTAGTGAASSWLALLPQLVVDASLILYASLLALDD